MKIKRYWKKLKQFFEPRELQSIHLRKYNSKKLLIGSFFVLLISQFYFYHNSQEIQQEVKRKYTTGFAYNLGQNFVYYYYYLSYFPIYSNANLIYNEDGAREILETDGNSLFMECEHWTRLGENARIFAFLPNAWLDGSPRIPSIKLFNGMLFTLGLISLLFGFYFCNQLMFGVVLVALLFANPFYLFETYANENIFGLLGAMAFIILGMLLPAIYSAKRRLDWLIVVVVGLLIGFAGNIRTEIYPILASPIIVYLFHKQYNIVKKLGLIALLMFSCYGINKAIKNYFEAKFQEAYEIVDNAGGHPYNGNKIEAHGFWHPVFCGLGDYDNKYGYTEWRDSIAYAYAIPILQDSFNLNLSYTEGWHLDEYYDEEGYYYKKFDEIPQYDQVIRNKVVADIQNDPIWYLDIILKRINKTLNNTIPIGFNKYYVKLKGVGWLLIPLLIVLIRTRNWTYLKLLIFTFPLMATSILIYSGGNSTYNSPYHFFVIVIIVFAIVEYYYFIKRGEIENV